jgi:hypothetical protein
MLNINEPAGSSARRSTAGGEIDSSVDPEHGSTDIRDRAGGEDLSPISTPKHANDDAGVDARDDAVADADDEKPFGGLTPSEAAQRRWAKERAREGSVDSGNADDVPSDAQIISVLRHKAARGDASAARELREWRDREAQVYGDEWMRLLDPRELRIVRRIIARAMTRYDKQTSGA